MADRIVGREAELSSVLALLDGPAEEPAGLVFEGEPGIGKSTLWLAGVEHARSRGLRVLSSRPAEAERGLAYAGLGDLLEGLLDDVLPSLSPPRRRALEGALLVEEATTEAVDPRALGLAVRDAFEKLAEDAPPVVAIDDLQWFDAASTGALAYALRRLDASPLLLLLARRLAAVSQPSELERALPEANLRRLAVGPLSVGALHTFLRNRLDRVFARQTLLRIHEHSGGNPFYALEIARALDGRGRSDAAPARAAGAERARARARLRAAGGDTQGARARRGGRNAVGAPARARRRRAGGTRTGRRSGCDRARARDDPLHPSAAGLGRLRRRRPRAARRGRRRPA